MEHDVEPLQRKCCRPGFTLHSLQKCLGGDYEFYNASRELTFRCANASVLVEREPLANLTCEDIVARVCANQDSRSMWGANTYMSANVAHVVLCVVVVTLYCCVPELGKSLYNRAVLRHYVALMIMGCLLSYIDLMAHSPSDTAIRVIWLMLQYFTLATIFWLNAVCVHMAKVITQMRAATADRDEDDYLLYVYGICTWGGALIPTLTAAFFEFSPHVPRDFVLKANYPDFRNGPKFVVNMYFFLLPVVTLFLNNVLFIFTSYKIVRICRSTKIATSTQRNQMKRSYALFVKLYVFMGSPWLFGSIFALMNNLIVIKVCRVGQPMVWLLTLLGDRHFRRNFRLRVLGSAESD